MRLRRTHLRALGHRLTLALLLRKPLSQYEAYELQLRPRATYL